MPKSTKKPSKGSIMASASFSRPRPPRGWLAQREIAEKLKDMGVERTTIAVKCYLAYARKCGDIEGRKYYNTSTHRLAWFYRWE